MKKQPEVTQPARGDAHQAKEDIGHWVPQQHFWEAGAHSKPLLLTVCLRSPNAVD